MPRRRPSPRKDKWSKKMWFRVFTPPAFGLKEIAYVPANSPKHLLNRTLEVSLFELTGDFNQQHIKLKFQIKHVEGDKAYTQFKGQELTRDYIRSIVRRGTSKVEGFFDVYTKDGALLRVAGLAITLRRAKVSQKKAIRKIMKEIIEKKAQELTFDEFIRESVLGGIAKEIFEKARKIYPLSKAEIEKIKVLKFPEVDLREIVKKLEEKMSKEKVAEKTPISS